MQNLFPLNPYFVPIQKETIHQAPYDLSSALSFLFSLYVLEHTCQLLLHLIVYLHQTLLV